MSAEPVVAEIRKFLRSSGSEVLCIRGKWGVGKTYVWRNEYESAAAAGEIKVERYSYVSLFGLRSLDEVKAAIFGEAVLTHSNAQGPTADTQAQRWTDAAFKLRKGRGIVDAVAGYLRAPSAASVLDRIAFSMMREEIVCLDDLERRGSSLDIRDVLGLASYLSDQRDCKVVLLLNSDEIKGEDFQRLLEKVADRTVFFEPTPAESARIGIPMDHEHRDHVRERVEALGIVNIRVIQQIARVSSEVGTLLDGHPEALVKSAIAAVALFVWSDLQPGAAPRPDFIKKYNGVLRYLRRSKGETLSDEEENWEKLLERYGFSGFDSLDEALFAGVENGYFNVEQLRSAALAHAMEYAAPSKYRQFWDRFHNRLASSEEQVLDQLWNAVAGDLGDLSLSNINNVVSFFRRFDQPDRATAVIDRYLSEHVADLHTLDRRHFFEGSSEIDVEFREALEDALAAYADPRDPRVVMQSVLANAGRMTEQDLALLKKQPAEFYVQHLTEAEGGTLRRMLDTLHSHDVRELQQGRDGIDGFAQAVEGLAAGNRMNRHRLAEFKRPVPGGAESGPEPDEAVSLVSE